MIGTGRMHARPDRTGPAGLPSMAKAAALFLVVAATYFLLNLAYGGPAYLADEIGFLSNAAFLAGFGSDGASSYGAGYSLLIVPAFQFGSDPGEVWRGVLLINALLWGGTAVLLRSILSRAVPEAPAWRTWLTIALLVLYPASVTMSGYAFSQSAFALCFTGAVATLFLLSSAHPLRIVPHAVLVGYLCWIHPTGLAVAVASVLAIAFRFRAGGWVTVMVNAAVILAMVLSYEMLLRPWMLAGMMPTGGAVTSAIGKISWASLGSDRFAMLVGLFFGQLGYLVVATFGFIVLGAIVAWGCVRATVDDVPEEDRLTLPVFAVFLVLSVLGIVGESALASTVSVGPTRLDHWIYGRYVEPAMLLLFGLGLLAPRPRWHTATGIGLFLLAVGAILQWVVNASGQVNLVNVSGFWPRLVQPATHPLGWFVLAAIVVPAAILMHRGFAMVLMAAVFLWGIAAQRTWHGDMLREYSNPSSIPEFVRTNYPDAECVGFDVSSVRRPGLPLYARERVNLYTFYLYRTPLRRLTVDQWKAGCEGPLLTFDATIAERDPSVRYVGRELGASLFVVVRKADAQPSLPPVTGSQAAMFWAAPSQSDCLFRGCYALTGRQLARFSQTGRVSDSEIASDGRAGYLVFGPYASLAPGTYMLDLEGHFPLVQGAVLDVVSDRGTRRHFHSPLAHVVDSGATRIRIPFALTEPADGLEVRMAVSAASDIRLTGYRIELASREEFERSAAAMEFRRHRLAFTLPGDSLPRQVGRVISSGIQTDGRRGFLMFGPYAALPSGEYRLRVSGAVQQAKGAWIDVASSRGTIRHALFPLPDAATNGVLIDGAVVLPAGVNDVEVRCYVETGSKLVLSGYSLEAVAQTGEPSSAATGQE